jgi:NACHT conflict system protein
VLRNLAVGQRPSESWAGAYEEFGVPLTALRSRLFGMLPAGDAGARLAKECLIVIDEYRDERGRAGDHAAFRRLSDSERAELLRCFPHATPGVRQPASKHFQQAPEAHAAVLRAEAQERAVCDLGAHEVVQGGN